MSSITTDNARQYGDSRKLAARARLNSAYMIAEAAWFPWVAERLPFKSGDSVLDVGCGPGWFRDASAGEVPEKLDLTLSDLSPGMVQEAAARCGALPFATVHGQPADAVALPFGDASFDAVIAMHML